MLQSLKIKIIIRRIFIIFTIGIIIRYFINEHLYIPSIIDYLDVISIFISYIINYLFIEPYINYDVYGYDYDKRAAQLRYNLDHNITNLASQQNPNNGGLPQTDPPRINDTTSQALPQNNNRSPHYYDEITPLEKRIPWVANHSNGWLHIYLENHNRISIRKDSSIENFDPVTKQKLKDAIHYDTWRHAKYIEFPIHTRCTNGLISLGIKYYGNPCDPEAYYIKHFDLVNKEHMWDIWRKDINIEKHGRKFKFLWTMRKYDPEYPFISDKLKVWKEIDKVTDTETARDINIWMLEQKNPFEEIHKKYVKNPQATQGAKRKNPFEDLNSMRTKR